MMAKQFPLWKDRIEYWHVDDLDLRSPRRPCRPWNRQFAISLPACSLPRQRPRD